MTSENDAWAQTLITVTPEDDATLREISDTVTLSSPSDSPLILDPDKIVYRRSLTHRQFIDAKESEQSEELRDEEPTEGLKQKQWQDAENQTYLQGIPTVDIPIEYQTEATQTLYMAAPCPPLRYFKHTMSAMNDGVLPEPKKSIVTATIVSFYPETPQIFVSEQLSEDVLQALLEELIFEATEEEKAETEATDILQYIVARVFWIIDPAALKRPDMIDKETQTAVRINHHTKVIYNDIETQTDLTCEPKESNTKLVSEYWETKNMIVNCLEDCISKGIELVEIVDDMKNEIIDKCVEKIRYPMKEQIAQTIATYKTHEEKEDVLRKLKQDVVVDPLEASIIVVPLFDDLLQTVCDTVSRNASVAVKNVLQQLLRRTSTIITKLIQLHMETTPKRMDEVLERRKKKIIDSMSGKETDTIGTQTSLTGVSEVKRLEKPKEILCSVCRRQSMCQWCLDKLENEIAPREETKILRTQDILLAYKPCYVIKTPSQIKENLQPVCAPETTVTMPPKPQMHSSTNGSRDTISLFPQIKPIKPQESVNEWSYVIEDTLMKPCSIKESVSSVSQITMSTTGTSVSKSHGSSSSHRSTLTSKPVTALQILKDTFCNQETCITTSLQALKQNYLLKENERACINKSVCAVYLSRNNAKNKKHTEETFFTQKMLPKTNAGKTSTASHIPVPTHGDGLKVIPVCLCSDSDA